MRIIPGHFRAYTSWLLFISAVFAYLQTSRLSSVVGISLIIIGGFLGDQATHLAQADHSALPPTYLEQSMQKHRWLFIVVGTIIAVFGIMIVTH